MALFRAFYTLVVLLIEYVIIEPAKRVWRFIQEGY